MAKSALLTARNNESCLKYRVESVIRPGKYGPSLECSQYPTCDYVRPLKPLADGYIVKVLEGQVCPACGANLVLRQGCLGMFIGYSNYLGCEYTKLIDKPDETTTTCPQCRMGHPVQRRSRYGRTFHSCNRYPECQFVINLKPIAGKCPECHYPLLIEKKTA